MQASRIQEYRQVDIMTALAQVKTIRWDMTPGTTPSCEIPTSASHSDVLQLIYQAERIHLIQNIELESGTTVSGHDLLTCEGQCLDITFCTKHLQIVDTLSNYLNTTYWHNWLNKAFYIHEEGLWFHDLDSFCGHAVENLIQMHGFISLLQTIADHTHHEQLIFLHKTKLTLAIVPDAAMLYKSLDGYAILKALMEKKEHSEEKKRLFKEALFGVLRHEPVPEQFRALIKRFDVFARTFEENYHLFVSEMSFDEMRDENEEKQRKYMLSLNEAYDKVALKPLAALGALIPTYAKLVSTKTLAQNPWLEFGLLLVGNILLGIFLVLSLNNCRASINAIQDDYTSLFDRFIKKFSLKSVEIQGILDRLNGRHDHIDRLLQFSTSMIALVLVGNVLVLLWQYANG